MVLENGSRHLLLYNQIHLFKVFWLKSFGQVAIFFTISPITKCIKGTSGGPCGRLLVLVWLKLMAGKIRNIRTIRTELNHTTVKCTVILHSVPAI